MAAFLDNCGFTPTAGGTTDWTVSAAVTGYATPSQAGAINSRVYKFHAFSADRTQWEITEGAYNSGTGVFARTTVLYNSSGTGTATGQSGAGTKINFSSAPTVVIVGVKEDLIAVEEANSFTKAQKAQARANVSAGAFSAHKNGTDQTGIASSTDTKVTFGTEIFDPDSCFDSVTNNRWTPPAGKVFITVQLWVTGTFPTANATNVGIWKNGAVFKEGFFYSGTANTAVALCTIVDDASGTDYYEVYVRQATSSGTVTVKGDSRWTFFMGSVI